jgi:putative Mn2+ efflux pump MntP
VTVCLSLLGLELGQRLGAAFASVADYLSGIVLLVVGLIVAVGYP